MGKSFVLTALSLCFLLLSGSMAFRLQPEQSACQLHRLNALEPDNRIQAEAGEIETWNPNDQQFQCTGVVLSKFRIESNSLHLPSYVNTPQLLYVQEGEGLLGMVIPGCAETFEDPLRQAHQRGSKKGWSQHDRHQKVRRIREGDTIAILAGMVHWVYNSGKTQLVIVALFDINSYQNQLGRQIPQRFYLGGNQEQEFQRYQQQDQGQSHQQQQQHPHQSRGQQEQSCERGEEQQQQQNPKHGQEEQKQDKGTNILSGFFAEWLAKTFNIDIELAEKLKGENDTRKGGIVKVQGQLSIAGSPSRQMTGSSHSEEEVEDEEQQQHGGSSGSQSNALEETLCTMRMKENIGKSTTPDIYNPRAGSVRTVNNLNLPILQWLKLSAERGSLHKGCMFVPHYNINAHSITYALRGKAHIQVVDSSGNTVFNGELEQYQALTVPQNIAVAALALTDKFEYVTFKTNERAMIATLAGRPSIMSGLPEDVIAVSFDLTKEEARDVKNKNDNIYLIEAESSGMSRSVAYA